MECFVSFSGSNLDRTLSSLQALSALNTDSEVWEFTRGKRGKRGEETGEVFFINLHYLASDVNLNLAMVFHLI